MAQTMTVPEADPTAHMGYSEDFARAGWYTSLASIVLGPAAAAAAGALAVRGLWGHEADPKAEDSAPQGRNGLLLSCAVGAIWALIGVGVASTYGLVALIGALLVVGVTGYTALPLVRLALSGKRPARDAEGSLAAQTAAAVGIVALLVGLGLDDFLDAMLIAVALAFFAVWIHTMVAIVMLPGRRLRNGSKAVWLPLVAVAPLGLIIAWAAGISGDERIALIPVWFLLTAVFAVGLVAYHTMGTANPSLRDVRAIQIISQVLLAFAILLVIKYLATNLLAGLDRSNLPTSFDFLDQPAGFKVRGSGCCERQSTTDLYLLGIKNTFLTAIVGIIIASVVGLVVGLGRLSQNWVINKLSTFYVEALRNTPVLLLIVLFPEITRLLDNKQDAYGITVPGVDGNMLLLSKSDFGVASPIGESGYKGWLLLGLVGLIVGIGAWIWRTRVNIATGAPHRRVLWLLGITLGTLLVGFFAFGTPVSLSRPNVNGLAFEGGFQWFSSYVAITVALGLYTASHIAEVVRGSIQAVAKGQDEAASALALSSGQRYRFVVRPQARRTAVPPTISQYLNLVKNTSLATAVGYADLTAVVKTSIGNGKPAPQSILVLMACYLAFSLTISLLLNVLNRRFQLKGN